MFDLIFLNEQNFYVSCIFRAFEIQPKKLTPGSIGKLRISSEMRQKLEMVTSNHSMRSTTKPEKPSLLPMKEQKSVKKLEDNRKLLLEQQLGTFVKNHQMTKFLTRDFAPAGRWDTSDTVDHSSRDMKPEGHSMAHIMAHGRSPVRLLIIFHSNRILIDFCLQMDKTPTGRPAPPPPPVTPQFFEQSLPNNQAVSRSSSFYSSK